MLKSPFEEDNILIVNQNRNCIGFIIEGCVVLVKDECKEGLAITFVKVDRPQYEGRIRCIMAFKEVISLNKDDFGMFA